MKIEILPQYKRRALTIWITVKFSGFSLINKENEIYTDSFGWFEASYNGTQFILNTNKYHTHDTFPITVNNEDLNEIQRQLKESVPVKKALKSIKKTKKVTC